MVIFRGNRGLTDIVPDVDRLRQQFEVFDELCHDYETCIEYIGEMNRSGVTDLALQREYRELGRSLELEITGFVRARGSKRTSY